MTWRIVTTSLLAVVSVVAVGVLTGIAMAGQTVSLHAASWSEADSAVRSLRQEAVRSPSDARAMSAALGQLERALSTICGLQIAAGQATVAPPTGPVAPAAPGGGRPDPGGQALNERLALQERLTMQTHRPAGPPAGPVGAAPPGSSPSGAPQDGACAEALSAAASLREAVDRGGAQGEPALRRLETALGTLRAARP